MTTTCPHCQGQITVHIGAANRQKSQRMAELQMMAKNGGWLFGTIARNGTWKTDNDLVAWLDKGLVELDEKRGFRITPAGRAACQN